MSEPDLQRTVRAVVSALAALRIPFHVTGGLASSYYGEPRFTQDIDLVVKLDASQGESLTERLHTEFLVEPDVLQDAVRRGRMFQALHRTTFVKVDFHVGERIEGELERSRVRSVFEGLSVPIVAKEDAILSKLVWILEGSGKSRQDVLGMLLDPEPVDIDFVRRRATDLGCAKILAELEREADQA